MGQWLFVHRFRGPRDAEFHTTGPGDKYQRLRDQFRVDWRDRGTGHSSRTDRCDEPAGLSRRVQQRRCAQAVFLRDGPFRPSLAEDGWDGTVETKLPANPGPATIFDGVLYQTATDASMGGAIYEVDLSGMN